MEQKKIKINKLKNSYGVTLTELLVAIIISSLLALSVGTISMISVKSSAEYRSEMEIYADISYGFKLMQKQVREMGLAQDPDTPGGSWVGDRLLIDNSSGIDSAFGLYQNASTNSVDFVFLPDLSDETVREVLLSVPNSVPIPIALNINRTGNTYSVQVIGVKNRVPFDLSTVIKQRIG